MSEKRIRRSQAEVEALISKVAALVKSGVPATKACEQIGVNYQSYQRHKAGSPSTKGTSSHVQRLLAELVETIRKDVRAEIKASL